VTSIIQDTAKMLPTVQKSLELWIWNCQ